jgi:NSS family neurotransmitter:Na+ symporter
VGVIVCMGYTAFYFEADFGTVVAGQILDVLDYISNSVLMPIVAIATCILVGWVIKPKTIIDEVTLNGEKFGREKLYVVMVKYVTPVLLVVLLAKSLNLL